MTILCATDFSPCSQSALLLARSLAQRTGDQLVLLHVVQPPVTAFPQTGMQLAALELALTESAATQMAGAAAECEQAGVKVRTQVLAGSAPAVILEIAAELRPRLIVLGTHGRRGLARFFLGSVASGVLKDTDWPVLVTGALPVNTERWAHAPALQLVVGFDGTRAGESALAWLAAQQTVVPHKRFLIRLYWPAQEALRYGIEEPWLDVEPHPQLVKLVDRDLERVLATVGGSGDGQVRFRPAHIDGPAVLAEEARSADADAIVIGIPRQRPESWNALTAGEVLEVAPRPVLCIPERAMPARRLIPAVRSILVATDLSDRSRAAMPRAYSLLREGGGRVELLHVHEPHPGPGTLSDRAQQPLSDERKHEIERQLRALVPPDAEARGILTRISVVEGRTAAHAILQAAERLDVDVVAVASHGRSGLSRALLGSVAEQVARHSQRPVLIIHQVDQS